MRVERIQLLRQIDVLDDKRCKKCHPDTISGLTQCDCKAAKAIRVLGDKLMRLTNSRNEDPIGQMVAKGFDNLTVELYKKVKVTGISDVEIFKTLKVSQKHWLLWKREAGLIKRKKELV